MSITPTNQVIELVTMVVAGQLVGVPMAMVRDVLGPQRIFAVPRAPRAIAGVLNLRGRIVTVVDLRTCLAMPPNDIEHGGMSVVVEHRGEPYSLRIDEVSEVLCLPMERFEANLVTLDHRWRQTAVGIFRLADRLLVQLDVGRVLASACTT
jgi:purine-binding chemotaxis protein CheW